MALNKSQGLQLFQGEITAQHHKDVEVTFKHVKYPCEHLKGSKTGQLYLTNFRVLFVNGKKNDMLQTFSMPFKLIKDFEIKQPMFGANYLEGKILAEDGGGWQGSAKFEIVFKAGGAIEVGQSLVKLAKNPQMMYISRQPMIFSPGATVLTTTPVAQNGYYPAQQLYAPPSNGYQPYAPPPNGYQPTAPPAYNMPSASNPGMPQPYPQPYPQPPYNGMGNDAKAAEAMASSSLPPGYTTAVAQPPPYDAGKKNQ